MARRLNHIRVNNGYCPEIILKFAPALGMGDNIVIIFFRLLGLSFREMKNGDPMRMAGATAFFTTFALPPIFIILFQAFTLFMNKTFVGTEMMKMLSEVLGRDGAMQIRQTTRGFNTLAGNWYISAIGFVFLLFIASTLFTVIKNTLNDIWNIKLKEKPGFLFTLWLRTRSLGAIIALGILFLANIFIESIEAMGQMGKLSVGWEQIFKGALNEIVGVILVTSWFIVLFRFLADGRPIWKATIAGGLLTGILFSAGKELLSYLIINSNLRSIYGASASIVLVLLFVFYSSFILYYGASFIKVYSDVLRRPIEPVHDKAFRYRLQKVD